MTTEVHAVFTDEMLKILSSMKGKTLKAIEGVFHYGLTSTHGNVRLVLGQFAVDIECENRIAELLDLEGKIFKEEFPRFSCRKKDLKDKFMPFVASEPVSFMINEVVSEVLLLRDEIKAGNGEHIYIDQALVVKTAEKAYTFSRCEWFLSDIDINVSDKIEGYISVKKVKEAWNGEGRYSVDVNRKFLFL